MSTIYALALAAVLGCLGVFLDGPDDITTAQNVANRVADLGSAK